MMRPAIAMRAQVFGRLSILGAILGLHLVVFAWLGLTSVPRLSAPPDLSPFVIEFQPRSARADGSSPAPHLGPASSPVPRDARLRPHETAAAVPFQRLAPGLTPSPPLGPVGKAPPSTAPDAAIAHALRNSALGCRLGTSGLAEQDRCDRILAEAAARAAPIRGTGHAQRDARFAAQGAEQLARYEDKRKPLKPYSRAEPCPGSPRPSDDCAVTIQGRIWSSQDGWLPDLPRPH
ncbi:MAG: hypothetical protein JWR59_952 [Brevundimonas sp.]|nr:hypothetical protein [Brevundimonas sp.]